MANTQIIKEKDQVIVSLRDWEKMQKELVRLRKKVDKNELLRELRSAIIEIETDIRSGRKPRGRDAREFVKELENEK